MIRRGKVLTIQPHDKHFQKRKKKEEIKTKLPVVRIVLCIVIFSSILVYTIRQQVYVNRVAIEIEELKERRDFLKNTNEKLRLEIEKQTSYEIIYNAATEQLGMEFPDNTKKEILAQLPDDKGNLLKNSGNYLIGKVLGADK